MGGRCKKALDRVQSELGIRGVELSFCVIYLLHFLLTQRHV